MVRSLEHYQQKKMLVEQKCFSETRKTLTVDGGILGQRPSTGKVGTDSSTILPLKTIKWLSQCSSLSFNS